MSKIFSCAAPLPYQQAMKMMHTQHNAIQTIMVQKVKNKIFNIYTMHSCIQNRVRNVNLQVACCTKHDRAPVAHL